MESFTVNEIREIFENIVKNSDRHGNSFYTELDGTTHSSDVGYFEECMTYFLNDLERISDGLYDRTGVKLSSKTINDYDNVREALQTIADKYVDSILLVLEGNDDDITNRYITINGYIKDFISDPKRYIHTESILNHNSYHIFYKEERATLILLLHAYKDQGK